jgi:hypothetical protein
MRDAAYWGAACAACRRKFSNVGASVMAKIILLLALLFTALVCLLPAAPAQATAARTFVSAIGSDSNNCANVASPCRHLAAAYAATSANGEIYVLDPANYGSVTITGPVSIEGHGWASIAPVTGQAAITINANVSDNINIIGVVLDGTAIANTIGIQFNSGGTLAVRDSVIRNFTSHGILFQTTDANPGRLFVSNTLVSDNGGYGIDINPTSLGTTLAVLDHVELQNNASAGLAAQNHSQTITVVVSESVSANSAGDGIFVSSSGGTPVNVMVRKSKIANNAVDGLHALGAAATIRVTRSTITGNNTGWAAVSSGVVLSYGDNNIDGNTNVNTEPPNPLTYK